MDKLMPNRGPFIFKFSVSKLIILSSVSPPWLGLVLYWSMEAAGIYTKRNNLTLNPSNVVLLFRYKHFVFYEIQDHTPLKDQSVSRILLD